jgi:hypothetical protein
MLQAIDLHKDFRLHCILNNSRNMWDKAGEEINEVSVATSYCGY